MLILAGTLAVVIGLCMIAKGIYEKEKKKDPNEEPLKDIEPIE